MNRAMDSTEVEPPRPDAATAVAEDRGETAAKRSAIKFGPGALVGVGALALLLYAAGSLGTGNKMDGEEDKNKPQAADLANGKPSDSAAAALLADPEPSGFASEDASAAVVPKEDPELARMREMRFQAQQRELAERDRLLAEARAKAAARLSAPVMILSGGGQLGGQRRAGAVQGRGGQDSAARPSSAEFDDRAAGQPGARGDLSSQLEVAQVTRVNASRMPNRNFTIEAGTQIPCVLQTALDSTLSGLVSCIVPYDVRSATGKVVLLEKGTRVLGEYKGGIQQGEARVFVVWNRAVTPVGVAINLGSPAADGVGRSGVPGDVNSFFWKRFGGALLLSLVSDASSAASNRVYGVNQTMQAPNSAANTALENDMRIKPVLRAPQGSNLMIVAAKDLDFSNVYSLRLKR